MADEHDERREDAEPETLEDAREQLRALRKELGQVRKESARRRQALKERDGEQADSAIWKTVAVEAVVQAEAAEAGAARPALLARLVDAAAIDGETLDEIRETVREQVGQALEEAPELRADQPGADLVSQGVRDRRRPGDQRPRDPDQWLRRAARGRR
jgi:hypothetical protein